MTEDSGGEKDLLGLPLLPVRDRRGRRKLRFPEETYEKVETLRGLNMTLEEIATAIGISVPSLRKYFFPELRDANAKAKAKILEAAMKKVEDGSVPAMRLALALVESGQGLAPPAKRARAAAAEPALGKKAQAELDALTAHEGTEWGHLLPN